MTWTIYFPWVTARLINNLKGGIMKNTIDPWDVNLQKTQNAQKCVWSSQMDQRITYVET